MKTFSYKGFDKSGRTSKGLIEALNVKDARERLSSSGILAERVILTGHRSRFAASLRAALYRELSALLDAGLPLLKALEVLIESPEMGSVSNLLASIRDSVRDGSSLASALSDASSSVTEFEVAIIDAAERSASMESMLDNLADFIEESEQLKERVHNALIYPTIVLAVGICVALVMLGVLVPRAQSLLAGGSVPLHPLTQFMITLGRWTFRGTPFVLVGVALTVFYVWRRHSDPAFREWWGRKLFSIPVFGRGCEILANLRFARTLAVLLEGGVSLIEGMMLAGRATGNAWIARLTIEQGENMRHGIRLSEALREIPPLAKSLPGSVQVGEASGGLVKVMYSAAKRYSGRWEQFVTRSLALLEPLMILIIGGFVLLVTLSILLPIISMTTSVSGG